MYGLTNVWKLKGKVNSFKGAKFQQFENDYSILEDFKTLKGKQPQGGFPVIAEITRCRTFMREINDVSSHSQHFNENLYCKNCQRVFSVMTGKPALGTNRN